MPVPRRSRSYGDDSDSRVRMRRDRSRPRYRHRSSDYDERCGSSHRGRRHHDSDDYEAESPPPRRQRAQTSRPERGSHKSGARARSRDRHEDLSREKREQAIKSAVTAGAAEAFRQRNRSGEWLGEKGLRVATAALSAAAIDAAVDKNPRRNGKKSIIGSTLGGLLIDKVASGLGGRG